MKTYTWAYLFTLAGHAGQFVGHVEACNAYEARLIILARCASTNATLVHFGK